MNRNLLLMLTPLLPTFAGVLILGLTRDPGSIPAILLFAIGSLLPIVLALTMDPVQVKRNLLRGFVSFGLLAVFNLLVITSIIVEVLALFTLFDLIDPQLSPRVVWYMWAVPSLMLIAQALILLERRIDSPRPALRPVLLAIAGVVTLFDLVIWTNAVLIEDARFLFATAIQLTHDQAVYLLLTGVTLQAVTAMILFRIPTLFELAFQRPVGPGALRAITSASPLIFTVAFTGATLIVSLAFVFLADRLFNLESVLPRSTGLRLVLVFPIALITFFAVAGVMTYQHQRARYRHKMDVQQKVLIWLQISSALATIVLWAIAWRLSQGASYTVAGFTIGPGLSTEFLVLGLVAATGPLGFYLQGRQRKLRYLEERLSDFLTDLAETSKAGLPLHLSLESAARKDYGPLTAEIQRMSTQCSWGLSFGEAFRRFGERSNSRLVRRAANLVVETSTSGGNTGEVLSATAHDIHAQKSLEEDRRTSMSTYIAVIYIVFFVFVGVLTVLGAYFLPELLSASSAAAQAGASSALFSGSRVSLDRITQAYFHALLVQSLGNGLVAGLVRDGSVGAGLRHAFFLVIVSYASYRFLIT